MKMNYEIRSLLATEEINKFFLKIIDYFLKNGDEFELYLSGVTNCLNKAYSNQNLYSIDKEAYKLAPNKCFNNHETQILTSLENKGTISYKFSQDDDENLFAIIKILNPVDLKKIAEWVKNKKFITNYEMFSLNTLTGEAYCRDTFYLFKPGSGSYNLFKAFLVRKNHFLYFKEIVDIQQQKYKILNSKMSRSDYTYEEEEKENTLQMEKAKYTIKYLTRILRKNGETGQLFKMYEKRGYLLQQI